MRTKSVVVACALLGGLLLCPAGEASAAPLSLYQVTFDTSALAGGLYTLDYQLLDGSGTDDGNATVTLSNFDFGGGLALGSSLFGGATGTVGGGVIITDNTFFSEFMQDFSAGNILSFVLGLSSEGELGPTPDMFTLTILDTAGTGFEIPTLGFFDVFVSSTMDGSMPLGFASNLDLTALDVPAPDISAIEVTSIPEPASMILLGTGLLGIVRTRMRRRLKG